MATRDQIPDILCQEQPLTTGCGSSWFISLWWFILQSLVWIQLHHLHTSLYLSKNWFLYTYIALLIDLSLYTSFCAVQPWSEETASQILKCCGAKRKQLERYPGTETGKDRGHKQRRGGGASKHILFGSQGGCQWWKALGIHNFKVYTAHPEKWMYLGFIGLSSNVHCCSIWSGEEDFTWGKRKRILNENYSAKLPVS